MLLEGFGYEVDEGHRDEEQDYSPLEVPSLDGFQYEENQTGPHVHEAEHLEDVAHCFIVERIVVYIEVEHG